MTRRDLLRLIALALAGLAWRAPIWWLGPLVALILPLWVPLTKNKRDRFILAVVYFAAGSFGLIPGSGVFFGHGATSFLLGAVLWAGSSALLALPWVFADARRPWTIIAAIGLDAIPPLGLFGWLSPLTAAGIFWPCTGYLGIIFLMTGIVTTHHFLISDGKSKISIFLLSGIFLFSISSNSGIGISGNSKNIPEIKKVDTYVGKFPKNILSVISRNKKIIDAGLRNSGNSIILFPETIAVWQAGTAYQYENSVPTGQTWLIGATTEKGGKKADSIIIIRYGMPSQIIFRAAFPVPVSMWHPWRKGGYIATWREPIKKIAGIKMAAIICYDQLLVWPWLEIMPGRPKIILLPRNEWWAKGTGIPVIQKNTAAAFSRLIGAKEITATNW